MFSSDKWTTFTSRLKAMAFGAAFIASAGAMATGAQALPALQLGPGTGTWSYVGGGDDTWYADGGSSINLNAYANDGSSGDFAWDADGAADRYAYLVVATVPDFGDTGQDMFNVSVNDGSGPLTLVSSGYGTPPVEDENSLGNHGIFDTYFEIYQFAFDGTATTIGDTQPGQTGTGSGYVESLTISISQIVAGVTGLHFDLFTTAGDGDLPWTEDKKLVSANAPFSHDAQWTNPNPGPGGVIPLVPVPAALPLMLGAIGLLGAFGWRRRTAAG